MSIVAVGTTSLVAFTLPSIRVLGASGALARQDGPRLPRARLPHSRRRGGDARAGRKRGHARRAEAVGVDLLVLKDGSQAIALVVTDTCARPRSSASPPQTPRRDAAS